MHWCGCRGAYGEGTRNSNRRAGTRTPGDATNRSKSPNKPEVGEFVVRAKFGEELKPGLAVA